MPKRTLLSMLAILLIQMLYAIPVYADVYDIEPGDTMTGSLERRDNQLDDDCYYDSFMLDAEQGTLVRITQRSDEIDCYLMVLSPSGDQWDNDDFEMDTLDSQLLVMISERGEYEIMCTSFSPEEGDYEVTVEEVEKPEFYGIFVGVGQYGREYEDAPLCDTDAENLFDAFVDSGLMDRNNGILLTNRDAELEDVEQAFRQIEREIGPNDTFIFFFSGHGDQQEATTDRSEIDGMDEAVCLRDVNLVDHDLAELLESLDNGLTVVVADACHAGGLARDVVNRPNVVCFASSEEDVLSDFAPDLDAGGYLSVFFREAIEGDADLDGDGMVLMGELAHYLVTRNHEEWPEPPIAQWGYQELVHDRGTVKQDDIFCWWDEMPRRHDRK